MLIKSAEKQDSSKFIEDIHGVEFDAYAATEVLKTALPVQSMLQVLEQTSDLFLPVPITDNFSSFPVLNLADVAIENLNLAGLKWLETKGITPTNVTGWGTPVDRAMRPVITGSEVTEALKDKQIQMIKYLSSKGYAAHLSGEQYDSSTGGYFSALGHGVNININQNHNAHLLPVLETMAFIPDSELPESDRAAIPSDMSALFANIDELKTSSSKLFERCKNVDAELLKAQQLFSRSEINQLIRGFAWDGESDGSLRELHQIDPDLVRRAAMLWSSRTGMHNSGQHLTLLDLLNNNNSQAALDYVVGTALDQFYTDQLFERVLQDTSLVSLWKSRVSPLAPSHFWPFSGISITQLYKLAAAGFDLGLTDIAGQDIYSFAIFELSNEHIEVLLTLSPPVNSAYGVDALDMLLDKIYLQDDLPAYTDKLLTYFTELEPNHLSRLARLKIFKPEIYQSLLSAHPRLAVGEDIKPNPVVYSKR